MVDPGADVPALIEDIKRGQVEMGWKQFVVEIVSSLAWPVTVLAILVFFRAEVLKMLQRLARLKYKDLELDFEKLRYQAEELHVDEGVVVAVEPETPSMSSLEEQILEAAESAPSAAILLAWSGLETSIAVKVSELAISPETPSYRSPAHNIDMLVKYSTLGKEHQKLLTDMRVLRNKVAHKEAELLQITHSQARDYAKTAIAMMKRLKNINRPGEPE